jgi:hypothetical protein
MKPYLVFKTWIDLDHVLAIGELQHESYLAYPFGTGWHFTPSAKVLFMFRDGPMTLHLGPSDLIPGDRPDEPPFSEAAQKIYADLLEAWKNRDNPADYGSVDLLVDKELDCIAAKHRPNPSN